jgi:hypothetical protein
MRRDDERGPRNHRHIIPILELGYKDFDEVELARVETATEEDRPAVLAPVLNAKRRAAIAALAAP